MFLPSPFAVASKKIQQGIKERIDGIQKNTESQYAKWNWQENVHCNRQMTDTESECKNQRVNDYIFIRLLTMPLGCIIVLDAMTPAHHVTNERIGKKQDATCYDCEDGNQLILYSKVRCGNEANSKKPKENQNDFTA